MGITHYQWLLRDSDPVFKAMLEKFSDTKENPGALIDYILNSDAVDQALRVSTEHLEQAEAEISNIDEPIRHYFTEITGMLKNRRN
ncbi:hypothetical protein [Jeotgalicoccus sp. WY2]|uniref:hypothetical protein n=1 Tax=Jeotgalicoccus sp. WY2 TaxID=2708346 RepID=UPI00202164AB|nr:hypothetical protein [Jeotgalicoccus sp. WY2]